jgi:hypothetical protein
VPIWAQVPGNQCPHSYRIVTAEKDYADPICSSFEFLFRSDANISFEMVAATRLFLVAALFHDVTASCLSAALFSAPLFCVPSALCSFPLIFQCPPYYTFLLLALSCCCHEAQCSATEWSLGGRLHDCVLSDAHYDSRYSKWLPPIELG